MNKIQNLIEKIRLIIAFLCLVIAFTFACGSMTSINNAISAINPEDYSSKYTVSTTAEVKSYDKATDNLVVEFKDQNNELISTTLESSLNNEYSVGDIIVVRYDPVNTTSAIEISQDYTLTIMLSNTVADILLLITLSCIVLGDIIIIIASKPKNISNNSEADSENT